MIQGRHGAGLALEAGTQVFSRSDVRWQHLHRDCTVEARIASFVHLAHATRPDGCDDLVRSELCTGSHFFNAACQFNTTVNGTTSRAPEAGSNMRNR